MDFIKYLQSLIEGLKLKEVFQKLTALFSAADPDLETSAIILSAKYNRVKTQYLEGTLPNDEYYRQIAIINNSLLGLITEINKNIELYSPFIENNTHQIIHGDRDKSIILFLSANPENTDLDLSGELEKISDQLSLVDKRQEFEFKAKIDLRKKDFQRAILELDNEPKFIHFAGSGNYKEKGKKDGLKLLAQDYHSTAVLEPEIMASILKKFTSLECLFLNACNTTPLAMSLTRYIPYIVSMDHYVSDKTAVSFSTSFYEAIASSKDIPFSFQYAVDNLMLDDSFCEMEIRTPRLMIKGKPVDYTWHEMSFEEWEKALDQCRGQKQNDQLTKGSGGSDDPLAI